MDIAITLDGSTRVAGILGDPIAQVKSPSAMTQAMQTAGHNLVLVPMHIAATEFEAFLDGIGKMRNLDGLVATVPHKFAAYRYCATATDRAHFLGAANVMRRNGDGSWHGDMVDGLGFLNALHAAQVAVAGQSALLVGAGGAGSAIGLALIDAGLQSLAIYDNDPERAQSLASRLIALGKGAIAIASAPDPTGRQIVVNASPVGMVESDPIPILADLITADMAVCDVITSPERTPLLLEAARRGCKTQTGADMYFGLLELMARFLVNAN